jgi:hypothetical protein
MARALKGDVKALHSMRPPLGEKENEARSDIVMRAGLPPARE